jgi:serine/threonine-protein kinase
VVQGYAVGQEDDVFYIAMEYIDGYSVQDMLDDSEHLDIRWSTEVIIQICRALDYAWREQALVHRDIKPDNIMIRSEDGCAKLADLGLAKGFRDLAEEEIEDEINATPQYISPETLDDAPVDT